MATKNIAITEDAYELLVRNKHPNESFSDVIRDHFKKKKHLLDYGGVWEEMPEKDWELMEKNIREARKGLNASSKKRVEALR